MKAHPVWKFFHEGTKPVKSTKSTTYMPHPYSKPVIPVKSLNLVKSTKATTDMPYTYLKIFHEVVNSVKSTKSTTDMPHTYSKFLNEVSEFC